MNHYSVYVLFLSEESGQTKKMKKQNIGAGPFLGYLYVGMTGLLVADRIANHVSGYKSCNLVKKFFTGEIFKHYDEFEKLFDYNQAVALEKEIAVRLRTSGYCVYQN